MTALPEKILYITYYWPPSGGAGVQRSLKTVKYLKHFGIEPVVLTVDDKKASYPVRDESLLKETDINVEVIRTSSFEPLNILSAVAGKDKVPYGGFAGLSKETMFQKTLRWIRGNLFIPDARKGWVKYAVVEAEKLILKYNIKTILISSPPHSSQLIGLKLKAKYPSLNWIADLRDPWTDIYYYNDLLHTKYAAATDQRYERKVLENCSDVIVVSREIRDMFRSKVPLTKAGFHIIPNGFDPADFNSGMGTSTDQFIITYTGTIAESYKPQMFFNALKKLSDAYPGKIKFVFVGKDTPSVRNSIHQNSLENISEFIPHVSHEKALEYMMQSSVLLLIIPDVPNSKGILTGKLFEYLGASRPVIGIGPEDGEAAEILNECSSGKMFNRNNEKYFTEELFRLYDDFKNRISFKPDLNCVNKYSREAQAKAIAGIILKDINR